MVYRRYRRASFARRARHKYQWEHLVSNNASPNGVLNSIDLLSNFRTHAGITINFPEIVIWRVHLRVSVKVTLGAAMDSADGVLITSYVDSINQAMDNPVSSPRDQHWLAYSSYYASNNDIQNGSNAAGTYLFERVLDIKSHRKLSGLDDTLWMQIAQLTANTTITSYSYTMAALLKLH